MSNKVSAPIRGIGDQATTKKKRQKRHGNSGGSTAGNGVTPLHSRIAVRGVDKHRRGMGRGGGRGGDSSAARLGKIVSSPIQLPFVKVTVRNIGNVIKHGSVEGIVLSVKTFLEGAFPNNAVNENNVQNSDKKVDLNAYILAWQQEKEAFDRAKAMLELTSSAAPNAAGGSSNSGHSFFMGWAYEEKSYQLPFDRETLLPRPDAIVSNVVCSFTNNDDSLKKRGINTNAVIDSAMSQMMQECGKQFLNYVGGRVFLEEDSIISGILSEKSHMSHQTIDERNEVNSNQDSNNNQLNENANLDQKNEARVNSIIEDMAKLNTCDKSTFTQQASSIRIRILSVTPVKKSKRRGEIGGKVELVLYPPDPYLLFKDACRDAARMAVDKYLDALNSKFQGDLETGNNVTSDSIASHDVPSEKSQSAKCGHINKKTMPFIPNFPRLSPVDRSRILARSCILMNRTIEAMKIHAKSISQNNGTHLWEISESTSQKTWKSQSHSIIGPSSTGSSSHGSVARGRHRLGDSRYDRFDGTIESSDDYVSFMDQLKVGGSVATAEAGAAKATTSKNDDLLALDEEGRPLAALVIHLRAKKEEEARAKADAAAAAAAAKVAASKREKTRQKEIKVISSKPVKKEDATSLKNKRVRKSQTTSSRASSSVRNGSMATTASPPKAVLLKRVDAVPKAIPTDGFNLK